MNSILQTTKPGIDHSHRIARSTAPISVLLIDDNLSFRQGLQQLLDFYSHTSDLRFQIVGHAASVEQGVKLAIEQSPSLILLDLELSHEPGDLFLQRWLPDNDRCRVLVLSGHEEDDWISEP